MRESPVLPLNPIADVSKPNGGNLFMLTGDQSRRSYLTVIIAGLFVMIMTFALIHLLSPLATRRPTLTAASEPPSYLATAAAPAEATKPSPMPVQDPALTKRQAEERRALARARLQQARHEADCVIELTHAYEREVKLWDSNVTALLLDDRGRQLATDPDAVNRFRSIDTQERSSRRLGELIRARMADLLGPVDKALQASDSDYEPSAAMNARLAEEAALIRGAIAAYEQPRNQIEGLLTAATKNGQAPSKTLSTALEELAAKEARLQAIAVNASQTVAKEVVREDVAVAEGTKVREVGKAEVGRIEADTQIEKSRIETDTVKAVVSGERERLLSLARDPAVQARYAPFLAKGHSYMYRTVQHWRYRRGTPPVPFSYRELHSVGALNSVVHFVAVGCSSRNDRPAWPRPRDSDWEHYRERFNEFKQLAPLWVELGVLRR